MISTSHASPANPLARSLPILTVVAGATILYVAQDFFLPLALGILISFLLAPVIRRLEHWQVGRVPSVIIATLLAFAVIAGIGYTIAGQLIDLANTLPTYKSNLHAKIVSLKSSKDGPWNRATSTLRELSAEFTKTDPEPAAERRHEPLGRARNRCRWRSFTRRATRWRR